MGKLTNLNPPAPIADADIPTAIARDAEVTAAMNAHVGAVDPHSQYLLPSEGDARYRLASTVITDAELPGTIARDAEVTAAMNAHVGEADPHTQYLRQEEADARYRQSSVAFFGSAPLPMASLAGNSIAFSWNSVQVGLGIGEICNYAGLGGGNAFDFFRMPGNSASTPTVSHRVASISISGAYVQASDKRVKSHLSSASGLEVIMKIKPLRYTHWSCEGFDEKNQTLKLGNFFARKIGFLAQDVQEVIPEAVAVPSSKEELWGIDYNCILACAVRAIQEQQQQIDELRAQLQAISK
jgi:hypothetical protein